MATPTNNNLLAKSISDQIAEHLDAAGQDPIIQAPEDGGFDKNPLVPGQVGSTGGGWTGISRVGTGAADPSIPFTKFTGGFNPTDLNLSNLIGQSTVGTPNAPRQFSAIPTATTGAPNEKIDMLLTWYPPLTDTTGRWLCSLSVDLNNNSKLTDLLESYLISRKDTQTGEEVVVAVVAHSDTLISDAKAYLEAQFLAGHAGANTNQTTLITTIDPSFYVNVQDPVSHVVLYSEPFLSGHEQPFSFTDHTAINGRPYIYYIQAVTPGQVESAAASTIPGAVQFASGLDLSPLTSWCSSFPNITGTNTGTESFVDMGFNCGSLVTSVEVALVPLLDGAMVIDTSAAPDSSPIIVNTVPAPATLQVPSSGSTTQTVTFVGRNLETLGGVTAIDLGAGITFTNPSTNLTKTAVVGSSTDWTYVATVTVASTAVVGIRTMLVTVLSGGQAQSSTIQILAAIVSTVGPTFDQAGQVVYMDTSDQTFTLTGTNMDKVQTLVPVGGSITITSKTATMLNGTYTGVKGSHAVTSTLVGGCTTTGKDSFKIFLTNDASIIKGHPTLYPTIGVRGV